MKILQYNVKNFQYEEVADDKRFRIVLKNGDIFDIYQPEDYDKTFRLSSGFDRIGITPSASNLVDVYTVRTTEK